MNLGTILRGLGGFFLGENFTGWNGAGEDEYTNFGGSLDNFLAKFSGSRLTNAEREANVFTAEQNRLAYERNLEADSTKYQRSVADMKAAGINPMLAAGGVSSSVSAPSGSSVAPGSGSLSGLLSFIAQMKSLKIQDKVASAQASNLNADTKKKQSETTGIDIANSVASATSEARVEYENLKPSVTRANLRQIDAQLDSIEATVKKTAAETETEASKKVYYDAAAILSRVNASNAVEMLPYQKMIASATTSEKRAAASLSAVSAAYKQGLIDNGYIEAFAREMAANAGVAENNEALSDIKTALRTGDYSKTEQKGYMKKDFTSGLLQSLVVALDNLNPLNNILK